MKQVLLFAALLVSIHSRGQITFVDTNTPWKELSKQANAQDKLIFIHFENSECVQCNEVASQGFSKEELKELFEENFIAIRCNVATPNGRSLGQQFGIMSSLMSLYVDPKGNILHVNNGSTSDAYTYLSGAELALKRKGQKSLADYDKEYKAGAREPEFMRAYMNKKRESSMAIDELLDEYVTALPADSLSNLLTVKTIYEFAPAINSKAYLALKNSTPQALKDSIFKISTPQNRQLINDGIIENSFRSAIRQRDEALAREIAEFSRQASRDKKKGDIAYAKSMIRYYYSTRNLKRYFAEAAQLVDSHYMQLTIDSLNIMDDAAFKEQQESLFPKNSKAQPGVTVKSFGFLPPSQFIHRDLNEYAFHFYELTRDKELLEKALSWSQKCMELADHKGNRAHTPYKLGNPNYLDTYAHILYKLDRKEEAIEWQTKAVEAQKVTGMPYQSFQITLDKMKTGQL